jgi:hypothetical protein
LARRWGKYSDGKSDAQTKRSIDRFSKSPPPPEKKMGKWRKSKERENCVGRTEYLKTSHSWGSHVVKGFHPKTTNPIGQKDGTHTHKRRRQKMSQIRKEMRRVRVCLCADSRDVELENFKSQVKSSSLIFLLFGSKKRRKFSTRERIWTSIRGQKWIKERKKKTYAYTLLGGGINKEEAAQYISYPCFSSTKDEASVTNPLGGLRESYFGRSFYII